jgi:hypothetical protein
VAYFSAELGRKLREAESVGWSPESPAGIQIGTEGKHTWPFSAMQDGISFARHSALTDDGNESGVHQDLASRARRAGLPGACCAATWITSAFASAARRVSRSTCSSR